MTPGLLWYGIARRFGLPANPDGLPGIARSFWSATWYPGLATLGLGLAGLVASVQGLRRREGWDYRQRFVAWAALVGLVLALMFSLGPNLPFNPFSQLPVLRNLSPFRGLLLVGVWLAVLAGVGVRWLLSLALLQKRLLAKSVVAAAVVIGIAGLIIVDHWPSSAAYRTTAAYFTPDETAAYAWLREHADQDGRLWDVTSNLQQSYVLTYSLSEVARPRYNGYYDNGAPLYTRQQLAGVDLPTSLRLHQTRYVLVRVGDSAADDMAERLLEGGYRVAYENTGVRLLENAAVGDYARFYRQAALDINVDPDASLGALSAFLAHNVALVAQDSLPGGVAAPAEASRYAYIYADPAAQTGGAPLFARLVTPTTLMYIADAPPTDVSAYVERDGYDAIRLGVSASSSGLLTIAESWYPHWRARVDDVAQPVVRANGALLGVWLEPGEHRVEFRYQRPWYIYVGDGVTIVTWLALVLWWTWYLGQVLKAPDAVQIEELEDNPAA